MHENVGSTLAAGEKSEAAQPIEPFDLGSFETASGRYRHMGARRRHLRRMHRSRFVHGQDAEGLQAARALEHFRHHARTLVSSLETVAAQAAHVQKNIGHAVVGNDEAKALGDVEPLDRAAELDDARGLVADFSAGSTVRFQPAARSLRSHFVRSHDAPTPPLNPGASCVRFESVPSRRYHSAANGKDQNAIPRRKRWMTVYI